MFLHSFFIHTFICYFLLFFSTTCNIVQRSMSYCNCQHTVIALVCSNISMLESYFFISFSQCCCSNNTNCCKCNQFILIDFSLIVKQALFAYVNHTQIHSWNQPVLSNQSKVSCSRKQRGPLIGLKLTTDKYPPITSQTRYPLRHAASKCN